MRVDVPGFPPWVLWLRPGHQPGRLFASVEYHFRHGGLPARNSLPAVWGQRDGWAPLRTVALPYGEGSLSAVVRSLLASSGFRSEEGLPEAVEAMVPDPGLLLLSLQVMDS